MPPPAKLSPDAIDDAAALLGVPPTATEQQLRAAYLGQVRQHPPDRDPELFERIRDAHDLLRDPATRARLALYGPAALPISAVLEGTTPGRRFVGTGPWLAVLKENRP